MCFVLSQRKIILVLLRINVRLRHLSSELVELSILS